jgi:hypothetical protein
MGIEMSCEHYSHMELTQTDKHGVASEMLARGNGEGGTADVLEGWLEIKGRI